MSKKRTPQTFEKRKRERDKQMKREAKQAARIARNSAKREAKEEGAEPTEDLILEHPARLADEQEQDQRKSDKP